MFALFYTKNVSPPPLLTWNMYHLFCKSRSVVAISKNLSIYYIYFVISLCCDLYFKIYILHVFLIYYLLYSSFLEGDYAELLRAK